jgi:hypothetical protein
LRALFQSQKPPPALELRGLTNVSTEVAEVMEGTRGGGNGAEGRRKRRLVGRSADSQILHNLPSVRDGDLDAEGRDLREPIRVEPLLIVHGRHGGNQVRAGR